MYDRQETNDSHKIIANVSYYTLYIKIHYKLIITFIAQYLKN